MYRDSKTAYATSNVDLRKRFRKASTPHWIEWKWVRGHSENFGNERADILAKRGLFESKKRVGNFDVFAENVR